MSFHLLLMPPCFSQPQNRFVSVVCCLLSDLNSQSLKLTHTLQSTAAHGLAAAAGAVQKTIHAAHTRGGALPILGVGKGHWRAEGGEVAQAERGVGGLFGDCDGRHCGV